MRQLKETYIKNGYAHKILWREEDFVISEVSDIDTGKVYCYEAFKVKKNPARTTKLMSMEAFESTPSNEDWGKKGYTARSLEQAHIQINRLKETKEKWTKNKNN